MTNETQTAIVNVWDKHEDEAWRTDQSHWRGVGRWKDDARWQAIGKGTVAKLRAVWRLLGRPHFPEPFVALEWGPGGGTNLFAMRQMCSAYYGVDISASNLSECGRMIGAEGYGNLFRPVLLTAEPGTIKDAVPELVDLFISTAVFQHFPSKEYGVDVLNALRSMCAPTAAGFIQIRFDNGNPKYRGIESLEQYEAGHITANSYAIDVFWDVLDSAGFRPLAVDGLRTKNNYATFYMAAK